MAELTTTLAPPQLSHPAVAPRPRRHSIGRRAEILNVVERLNLESLTEGLYVDLFCGAGGSKTGAAAALRDLGFGEIGKGFRVIAVNHDPKAIQTVIANYPTAEVCDCDLERLDPATVLRGRTITVLWGSAPCQCWSNAAGGPAKRKQRRATPDYILAWLRVGRPLVYIEENVWEITTRWSGWKGHVRAIEREGYTVEIRKLNAADYGDPQARKRLILVAVRKGFPLEWAKQTHSDPARPAPDTAPWNVAAGILDENEPCPSIFNRRYKNGRAKPLSRITRTRIARHIRDQGRFWVPLAEAVVRNSGPVPLVELLAACPQDEWPTWVLCGEGGEERLRAVEFVLGQQGGAVPRSVQRELPTIATAGYIRVGELRCILPLRGRNGGETSNPPRVLDRPLHTIVAGRDTGHVVEPRLVRAVPVPPVVLPHHGERRADGARRAQAPRIHRVDRPLPTIPASRVLDAAFVLVYSYNGNAQCDTTTEPLTTVTTIERHALVAVHARDLLADVGMRMLTLREIARGQSFPDWYVFCGNKREIQRQIGNAVPVRLAYAVVHAALAAVLDFLRRMIPEALRGLVSPGVPASTREESP